jgi:4-amino-4-deoxy-L-arabinose transferase-like glycosyltransferase
VGTKGGWVSEYDWLSDALMHPYVPYVVLLFNLTVGFFMRIHNVTYPPLMHDEALMGIVANSLAETGRPLLPAGYPSKVGLLTTYIFGFSTSIFGKGVFAIRFPGAIVGTATIGLVYLFGKEVGNEYVGSLAATVFTFSLINVAWARSARFYVFLQFLVLVGVYAYLQIRKDVQVDYERMRPRWSNPRRVVGFAVVYLVAVVGAYFTHPSWPVLLGIVGLDVSLPNRNEPMRIVKVKILGWLFVMFVAGYVALTQSAPLLTEFLGTSGIRGSTGISLWQHPRSGRTPVWFFLSYYPFISIVALIGSFVALWRWDDAKIVLVAFYAPLYIFTYFGSQFRLIWRPRYLLMLMPFFFVLAALAFVEVIKRLLRSWNRDTPEFERVALVGVALLLITTPVAQDVRYVDDPYELSQEEIPQPSYKSACQVLTGPLHEEDVVITNRPVMLYFWIETLDYRGNNYTSRLTPDHGYYTGVPMIDTAEEMKEVVENHDRVWVVYNPYMPLRATSWIKENMTRYGVVRSPFDTRFPYRLYDLEAERGTDEWVYIYGKGIQNQTPSSDEVQTDCES